MDKSEFDEMLKPERKPQTSAPRLNFVPPPEVEKPEYASVEDRAKALGFDALLWLAAFVPLELLFGGFRSLRIDGPPLLFATVLWLVYMTFSESRHGASWGKRRKGLRVVMEDGGAIHPEAALLRNLLRFLDAAPYIVPYLVGAHAASKSPHLQRYGDRVAETIVVYAPANEAREPEFEAPVYPSLEPDDD
jgi:uncharacterized RDD family membrane protein YckC